MFVVLERVSSQCFWVLENHAGRIIFFPKIQCITVQFAYMKLLIRQATIIDVNSPYHRKTVDLLIEHDKITSIGANLKVRSDREMQYSGLFLSPGWLDLGVQVGDPGLEEREDLLSATAAAAAGGFTAIAALPNTQPVLQSKAGIHYLQQRSRNTLVEVYPIGAATIDCAGRDMTEMIDLYQAGAVAFSDGDHPIQDNATLLRSLEYVKSFDGLIINQPLDRAIAQEGQMHEGVVSTSLGLKGIPNLAEDLMVLRDIYLTEYAQSRIHLANLSTARSIDLVRQAKAKGLAVTCSVAVLNLAYDDRALVEFDSGFKVMPPLREPEDAEALRQGLKQGIVDVLSSNHVPLDEEHKKLEFPYASFGASGLETAWSLAHTHLEGLLTLEEEVEKWSTNPRKILGLPAITIREGAAANLTLFDPAREWKVTPDQLFSKARNNPLLGKTLRGRVIGVINRGQFFQNAALE